MLLRPLFLSRLAALGLLAAVGALGWAAIVQPAVDWWMEGQQTNANVAEQANHLTLVAGRRAGIEAALRQLNTTLSDPALFWIGPSGPSVSAAIQERLREVVRTGGGHLRSTTDLPAPPDHGLSRVALRLQADGTVPALQAVLYAIETSKPALCVDGFAINASDSDVAAASQPPVLSIQLDVFGFSHTP